MAERTWNAAEVHAQLRAVMLANCGDQLVEADEVGQLVVRTRAIDPKTKQAGWFGTVTIKKSYVAYHLMPLYADPALGEGMSLELAKRRQGKSCFNFTAVDERLFAELAALTRRASGGDGGERDAPPAVATDQKP